MTVLSPTSGDTAGASPDPTGGSGGAVDRVYGFLHGCPPGSCG